MSELTQEEQERLSRLKALRLNNQLQILCDLAMFGSLLSGLLIGTLLTKHLVGEDKKDV